MNPQTHELTGWKSQLALWEQRSRVPLPLLVEGEVASMVGLTVEAVGCRAAIGERCLIQTGDDRNIEAEVVGFRDDRLFLMPTEEVRGVRVTSRVIPTSRVVDIGVGPGLIGRILDSYGRPLDNGPAINEERRVPIMGQPINPLDRRLVREPLDVGVRAINGLLTLGKGQRAGLFAGSGVGKSVLMGMITRYTAADVVVLALIGERGREVPEFIDSILGREGMRNTVVIVSPSDDPPLKRLYGAYLATAIAEYFRDCGKNVLLMMDSLTRFAQAQREIALAVGEPPVTRGYPPSVFARIPQLVERVGALHQSSGSITGIYTVLAESNDRDDPIVDCVRATLDGHIFLDRNLADAGIFPAIDIGASISRVFTDVADPSQIAAARRFRSIYSLYREQQDMVTLGAYKRGADPRTDEAIDLYPNLVDYIRQDAGTRADMQSSIRDLHQRLAGAIL